MDDVTARVLVLLLVLTLVVCSTTASADDTAVVRLGPVQDISLPFWCDWGYDWDERCYRDDGDRLPIGGEDDKVWRAALRFSTSSLPPGSAVVRAILHVFHDGRCLGPRKTLPACEQRDYGLEAHPILSADWFKERELDFGPAFTGTELDDASEPQWLSFDLTELVAEWVDGSRRNSGVLLKLAEGYEDFGVSGPSPPSAAFAQPAFRPLLEVTYVRASD
jgi:TGF-beta propeptide